MRILIAEDDLAGRKFLFKFLSQYGECDITIDGKEALEAYLMALKTKNSYDLICLDIMMPKVDGVRVLKAIRDIENQSGISNSDRVKIIMTTALAETSYVYNSFETGCEAYASKPIDTVKFVDIMKGLGLVFD